MSDLADRLRASADLDEVDAELLYEAADQLDALSAMQLRDGTAANYLQHRLPAMPFTAFELAEATRMNLRTVQQAIVHLRAAGLIRHCGYRRRTSGKGQHPRLYVRCV